MAISEKSLQILCDSVRDGSFPDDNELLTANLTSDLIPSLLATLSEGKNKLKGEIRDISKGQAGDVDEWISQAKKVQDDIAKCRIEARHIVEEHERVEVVRQAVRGANNKVQLLEAEIAFTRSLEHEMQSITEISQVLDEAGNHLIANDPAMSVEKLGSVKTAITSVSVGQPRNLLSELEVELRQNTRSQLQGALEARWVLHQDEHHVSLRAVEDTSDMAHDGGPAFLQTDILLDALTQMDALPDATAILLRKLEGFVLPLLASRTPKQVSSTEMNQDELTIMITSTTVDINTSVAMVEIFINFLDRHLPRLVRDGVAKNLLPKVISSLILNRLNSAIPQNLEEMQSLEVLQEHVLNLASLLSQYSWPGPVELSNWVRDIPQTWLAQRQRTSLDVVRKSFTVARGSTRQAERIERQVVSKQEAAEVTGQEIDDDWNVAWEDEPTTNQPHDSGTIKEDEASGWDLEIEDESTESIKKDNATEEDNDSSEAWGWGDESPKEAKKEIQVGNHQQANGQPARQLGRQEMVLTETYTITDIPDHMLELIDKELLNIQTLKANPEAYFKTIVPEAALQSSPALILSMFRATAPTHYSHSTHLVNMHLYNDTLYIVQKLLEDPNPTAQLSLSAAIEAMSRFARQTYTRELDIQRTILSDLLDGAQGFESCTEAPYDRECKNAIDGVIDRVRQVRQEWKEILGRSHLMQSVGSLITMVMHKIVRDVEDMEDITEAQGQRLVEFCHSVSTLESLFVVSSSAAMSPDQSASLETNEPISTIALYVPNYFRFQYLIQILESNLVEINYLWKEGELSLEFSAEEVVDLIKALFAESHKRREAIYEIKRSDTERPQ